MNELQYLQWVKRAGNLLLIAYDINSTEAKREKAAYLYSVMYARILSMKMAEQIKSITLNLNNADPKIYNKEFYEACEADNFVKQMKEILSK